MRVLVLGGGGREHAICDKISQSPLLTKLYALPGNFGISQIAKLVKNISLDNFDAIRDFIIKEKIDLVIVGPEQPLVDGIVDYLKKYSINALGPDTYGAKLESSKSFTKELCDKKFIKTAKYKVFSDNISAIDYIKIQKDFPIVIKADGLAEGKGVVIVDNEQIAIDTINEIFNGKFGYMEKIVIEEFLTGVEASYFAISDGKTFKLLSSAGDHKKIGEGDTGLNTGGMGAYSPSPFVTEKVEKKIIKDILQPTFEFMREQGFPYKGIIFVGLMIKNSTPYFN